MTTYRVAVISGDGIGNEVTPAAVQALDACAAAAGFRFEWTSFPWGSAWYFEHGRMSRRQLIGHLTGMFAATVGATIAFADQQTQLAAPSPADSTTTFDATDLNHIALSVSDVQRSEKWYQKHLGLKAAGQEGFLTTGKGWLALFKGEKPGLHHYCYSIANYDPADAVARLKAAGLAPKRRGDRVYFDDPDGIECQVAGA